MLPSSSRPMLWAADFFSVRTWTMRGLVDCYAMVFMHVETRRVIVSPVTVQPDRKWVAQQLKKLLAEAECDKAILKEAASGNF